MGRCLAQPPAPLLVFSLLWSLQHKYDRTPRTKTFFQHPTQREKRMEESSGFEFLDLHPFVRQVALDRLRGMIFGGALGDAIGLYTEFLPRAGCLESYPSGQFQLVEPATKLKNDRHRNKFEHRSWTDDTDHALLLMFTFLKTNGGKLEITDFARRLQFWCEQGLRCLNRLPLGLGRTVGRVVCDKEFLKDPTATAYRHWRNSNCKAAPNGSLMRTHPLGAICLDKTVEETFQIAADFSRVTHADPRCIVSCCAVTALIRGILRGEIASESQVDEMLGRSAEWIETWLAGENEKLTESGAPPDTLYKPFDRAEFEKHTSVKFFDHLELDDSMKMGYVYKTLGAGILALRLAVRKTNPRIGFYKDQLELGDFFEDTISELVMLGGDADTNATVAGALMGALIGYRVLPGKWRDGLMNSNWLLRKCNGLAFELGIWRDFEPSYGAYRDPDIEWNGGLQPLTQAQLYEREHRFMAEYMAKAGKAMPGEKGWMDKLLRR